MDLDARTEQILVVCLLAAAICASRLLYWLALSKPQRKLQIQTFAALLDTATITGAIVFLVIKPFVLQSYYIPSPSMMPTLAVNDHILVNRLCYNFSKPHRDDVVVFRAPFSSREARAVPGLEMVKRVIGVPGDIVEVHAGKTYINGQEAKAAHADLPLYDMAPFVVPEAAIFVLGDNRNESSDSHVWGAVPNSDVEGRAVCIFWPPGRISAVK